MVNNYELHSNHIIYLSYSKQLQMVDMEKVGKVRLTILLLNLKNWFVILVIDSMPSLPSFTQLNTIIRQSNNLKTEHLCLIRACLLKQQKINE